MPNPRGLALLSTHLEKLLGREYRSLALRYHELLNEDKYAALEKDAHRAHVAVLTGLVRREDTPSLILETLNPVLKDCLPVYHVQYEVDREASIRLALEKIRAAILKIRGSHWSRRDLALEVLDKIQQGYEWALAHDVANIQTRVGATILEQGYYSLDVKTARRLLCIDAEGREFRENRSGAHAVCAANGIHYKPSPKAAIGTVGKEISEIE
ncbi:MAG: hypothetical protein K2Q33_03875, partial [Gammaproteobacteria bacterium]|nr:hypothetical protein [Gammaproteobacteria bacterium]